MKTYTAVVTREGDAWLGDVPSLQGAHTWASTLDKLHESVRDVVILADDLPDDAQPSIEFEYRLDDPLLRDAVALADRRREFEVAAERLRHELEQSIHALRGAGHSVRETAALVGVTPGRVSQVAPTTTAAAPPRGERTVTETRIKGGMRATTVTTARGASKSSKQDAAASRSKTLKRDAVTGRSVSPKTDALTGSFTNKKPRGT